MINKAKRAIEEGTVFTYLSSHMLGVPAERLHRFTVQGFCNQYGPAWAVILCDCATGEERKLVLENFAKRYTEVSE
tara:strand:+ start:317 stop:544 length:228 start_codon:yes stop_codon:yes gene_type:complete